MTFRLVTIKKHNVYFFYRFCCANEEAQTFQIIRSIVDTLLNSNGKIQRYIDDNNEMIFILIQYSC